MTELERLAAEIAQCQKCQLARGRIKTVPGYGAADARLLFIGEAPGFHEDRQGLPFVGPDGQFLDELLRSIGMSREQVFICNVVKCRPPNDRDPLPSELEACRSYLDRQIEFLRPRMIVTLGRYSMARYFPNVPISHIHGRAKKIGETLYLPLFHPAAALHQPRYRSAIEQDFLKIPDLLKQAVPAEEDHPGEQAEQLNLF